MRTPLVALALAALASLGLAPAGVSAPGVPALPLAALAAVGLALTLGPTGRRALAVLAALLFGALAGFAGMSGAWPQVAAGVAGAAASGWLFRRPGRARGGVRRGVVVDPDDPLTAWKALDAGVDPTDGPATDR